MLDTPGYDVLLFPAYLRGIETHQNRRLAFVYLAFPAYLRGIETVADPFLKG